MKRTYPPTFPLSAEQCVEIGGHCFDDDGYGVSNSHSTSYRETCTHCGAKRWATPRHPYSYSEIKERDTGTQDA